jgi:hypothetical protein
MRTYSRTHMTKRIVAFHNFAKAPKKTGSLGSSKYKCDALLRPIRLCPSSSLTVFRHRRTHLSQHAYIPKLNKVQLETHTVTTLTRVDVSSCANMHCHHTQTRIAGLLVGSRSMSTDLYPVGTRFESRPGHPKIFEVILTHLQRMSGQHQAMTEPFHILSNRVPYNPYRWTLCRLSY